jgi:hypothetical protein
VTFRDVLVRLVAAREEFDPHVRDQILEELEQDVAVEAEREDGAR